MPAEVEVRYVSLDAAPRLRELGGFLSADERERAARFRFDRDRNRFIVCRGTLRELLAARLRIAPASCFQICPWSMRRAASMRWMRSCRYQARCSSPNPMPRKWWVVSLPTPRKLRPNACTLDLLLGSAAGQKLFQPVDVVIAVDDFGFARQRAE